MKTEDKTRRMIQADRKVYAMDTSEGNVQLIIFKSVSKKKINLVKLFDLSILKDLIKYVVNIILLILCLKLLLKTES